MFAVMGNKGFHITLPNGITISTQFGGGNYCDNYDSVTIGTERDMAKLECRDAELAIWQDRGKKSNWITREVVHQALGEDLEDDVIGRIDNEKWLKIFDVARNWKEGENGR